MSSLFTVTLLAFDRLLYIHKPLRYERMMTVKRVSLAVVLMWVLCFAISMLHFLILRNAVFSPELLICLWDTSMHHNFVIFTLLVILIPYILGIVCNVWVIVIVVRNIRAVYKVQKMPKGTLERNASRKLLETHMRKTRNKKQLHLTRVFGGIICSNTVAWLPVIVLSILTIGSVAIEPQLEFIVAAHVLFSLQVVIHPILETTLINDVRKEMKRIVTCSRCCEMKNKVFVSHKASPSSASNEASASSTLPSKAGKDGKGSSVEGRCCCHGRSFCGCGLL